MFYSDAKYLSRLSSALFVASALVLSGCAAAKSAKKTAGAESASKEEIGEVKISEFTVSPGDELNIVVYQHDEFSRRIKIPPDGKFFYPIVGEVDAKGKSLSELRRVITKGLSEFKEQAVAPGDEISISIYGNADLNRRIIIPSDGRIFFPLVGEINTEGKTFKELRKTLTDGLSKYKKDYLSPGDEISITVYRNPDLDRKIIIPPDGYIYYPFVGDIKAEGSSMKELREKIREGLIGYVGDVQVSVDVSKFGSIKVVVDPQVSVDIARLSNTKRIADPQVGIEVSSYGGQKIFVLGEVKSPGIYLADGNTRVIEAISAASGPTLDGKQSSILLVRNSGKGKPELQVVDIEKALSGDSTQNPILKPGDIVYVPRTMISNVDRFFGHLSTIISPVVSLETGYFLGQQIEGNKASTSVTAR
ncbi:MAG: polysaccharide biosynthesis/export family protein [Deltaproteobacteria bacterium]|nr:polysaccharide biosynthesis/export family protein [Deltaproteobacteria bacterium]